MTAIPMRTNSDGRLAILLTLTIFLVLAAADRAAAQKGKPATPAPPGPREAVPEQLPFVEEESPPALKDLTARLTKLLKADCPEAQVALHGRELKVRYRTQKFMVHGQNKTGEFAERAHEEEGPKFRGFLLHVYYQEKRPLRALVVPSDVQGPYWTTFVNDFGFAGEWLTPISEWRKSVSKQFGRSMTASELTSQCV